jgi:hypothetical protein
MHAKRAETCIACRASTLSPAGAALECAEPVHDVGEQVPAIFNFVVLAKPLKPASTRAAATPMGASLPVPDKGGRGDPAGSRRCLVAGAIAGWESARRWKRSSGLSTAKPETSHTAARWAGCSLTPQAATTVSVLLIDPSGGVTSLLRAQLVELMGEDAR